MVNAAKLAKLEIRPARKSECRTIAELYRISSDGVSDYVWSTLAEPGEELLDVGERRYQREESVFSYRNCHIAELDGEVVGMIVAFPMSSDPDSVESDPVLAPYSRLEEDNSYYVCGVAVFPEYRGCGLGSRFMCLAERQAAAKGLRKLSLIVFEKNEGAKRLYETLGYKVVARETVVPHPLIHHTGDALLMVKPID